MRSRDQNTDRSGLPHMLAHLRPEPETVLLGIRHRKDVAISMTFAAIQELDPSDAAVPAAGRADQAMIHHEAAILARVMMPLDEGHDGSADALDIERERLIARARVLERNAIHARCRAES